MWKGFNGDKTLKGLLTILFLLIFYMCMLIPVLLYYELNFSLF